MENQDLKNRVSDQQVDLVLFFYAQHHVHHVTFSILQNHVTIGGGRNWNYVFGFAACCSW